MLMRPNVQHPSTTPSTHFRLLPMSCWLCGEPLELLKAIVSDRGIRGPGDQGIRDQGSMGSGIKEITDTIIQEALGRLVFALVLELVLACACAEYKQIRDQ